MVKRLLHVFIMAAMALILIPLTASANSYDTAEPLEFTGAWSGFHYIADESEEWYLVNVPSDGLYELRVMNYTDVGMDIDLKSADLSTTFYEDYIGDGTETSPKTVVFNYVLTKGTYYLVLDNDSWADKTIKFKMKNSFTSYKANDGSAYSFDSPQNYTFGTTITGLLGRIDEEDWFKIKVKKNGVYKLHTKSFFTNLEIDIRNEDSSESVWSSDNYGGTLTSPKVEKYEVSLSPGTYYIKMYPNRYYYGYGDEGKYSFSMTAPGCSHNYSGKVIAPTYFKGGYTKYTCKFCGKSYTGNKIKKKVLKTGSVTSLKANKKKLTLKWKKVKGASGYQVRYTTNKKNMNYKVVNIKKNATVKKTIKSLKSKKRYYVQVRAYKTVKGKTVYGKWSKKKSVVVK